MASICCALLASASALGFASATVLDLPIIVDNGYNVVEVDIGTPSRPYRFLFDTGSATAWAVSSSCGSNCPNVSGYARVGYDVEASSTGQLTGDYGVIDYLGGNTAGPIVSDLARIGDFSWTQTFMAANESNWAALPADGFMGFAFSSISVGNSPTFMETLMPSLDAPRFGIYYGADPTSDDSTDGVLTLGASREAELSSGVEVATIPIAESWGYEVWRSNLMAVSTSVTHGAANDTPVDTNVPFVYTNAVFDTGGSGIMLPEDNIEEIYNSIGFSFEALLAGKQVMMCDDFNSSWSVTFHFASEGAELIPVTLTGDQLALPGFPAREGSCWPPFEPGDFSLLGKLFLRDFYTVWDFGAKVVDDYKPTLGLWGLSKK